MTNAKEAVAAMLLTLSLSPNKEEYAKPFSTQEYYALCARMKDLSIRSPGDLPGNDISTLMARLCMSEEECYRIYTLTNRMIQLSYAQERLWANGVRIITRYDKEYPKTLTKLKEQAPVCLYAAGVPELTQRSAIAVMGISGVKTLPNVREGITDLVKSAAKLGYAVVTGGEPGVSRVAAAAVRECGGWLIDIVGGAMYEHLRDENIAALLREGRALILCAEHPEALFTVSHAIARNKLIFSMADAAFICNTDNKRGEADALNNRYCGWIYAWTGYPANSTLVSRGAIPLADLRNFPMEEQIRNWKSADAVQLSMFDDE